MKVNNKGFSLIETLLVLSIMATLAFMGSTKVKLEKDVSIQHLEQDIEKIKNLLISTRNISRLKGVCLDVRYNAATKTLTSTPRVLPTICTQDLPGFSEQVHLESKIDILSSTGALVYMNDGSLEGLGSPILVIVTSQNDLYTGQLKVFSLTGIVRDLSQARW